jgi:ribosomal subunit interface protein
MIKIISFRNLDSIAHLRDFIDRQLEQTIGLFVDKRPLRAKVLIEKKQFKSTKQGHPDFNCEIVLYHPELRKQIVAKKASSNFYQSITEACRAVEKTLRRLAQTKSKRRHKNYKSTTALNAASYDWVWRK